MDVPNYFESVNTAELREKCTTANKYLDRVLTSHIAAKVTNSDIWISDSSITLSKAFIENAKDVSKTKSKIANFLTALGLVDEIKKLQQEMSNILRQISSLESRLNSEKDESEKQKIRNQIQKLKDRFKECYSQIKTKYAEIVNLMNA